MSESEARASEAERKAAAALEEAEAERRRARAERHAVLAEARRQADLSIGAIEAEVAELRGALARETLTEARVEGATRRLEARRAAIPQAGPPPPIGTPSMRIWQVGDRAVAPGGWDGILGAIDTERGRGSLEVGGMRVDVDLGTLRAAGEVPPAEATTPAPTTRPRTGRRGEFGPSRRRAGPVAPRRQGVPAARPRPRRVPWPRALTCGAPASKRRSSSSIPTSTAPPTPRPVA